jgi:uncharacterized protein (DUF885 family)
LNKIIENRFSIIKLAPLLTVVKQAFFDFLIEAPLPFDNGRALAVWRYTPFSSNLVGPKVDDAGPMGRPPATVEAGKQMSHAPSQLNSWLDDFFADYYRHRPVNATFIGEHTLDHRLPDFSEDGQGDLLASTETLRSRLRQLPAEPLSQAERIDRTLAEGFLEIQRWESTSAHFQRGNPSLYTGEAIFGIIGLFLTDYALVDERVAAAIERMEQIPTLLAQATTNVRRAPAEWTTRALRECEGADALFGAGIDELIAQQEIDSPHFRRAANSARAAFAHFADYLQHDLLTNSTEAYAAGQEAFDLMLRAGHCVEQRGSDIIAYAEDVLTAADAELTAHAADFDAATPEEALRRLADFHPPADEYYARYSELWHACHTLAVEQELLTWPDFPIEYVPRPQWVRAAAPYLYFLFYRSPAAVNRPPIHHYLVAPLDPALSAAEQMAFLRANNDSVIKLNHVVHHGAIGHHVQNWHAFRAESRIGRIAAVDCASRIAMLCGGTMAEGWACYATDLMGEAGFLTPLERYAEAQSRRRMAARAIVDVKLHYGEFTLEQAADFYAQRAAMSTSAARGEAVKNSMFPGGAMMYLYGTDMIHALRRDLAAQTGSDFNLAQFHDHFLAYGSIPVALISAEMRAAAGLSSRVDI